VNRIRVAGCACGRGELNACRSTGDNFQAVTMRSVALVVLGAIAIATIAPVIRPSEAAAAPKRHQQVQYYTITLTESRAPRGPRLKTKPQTATTSRHFQGFVSRFSAGSRR
jgi:hypothetical protein